MAHDGRAAIFIFPAASGWLSALVSQQLGVAPEYTATLFSHGSYGGSFGDGS